MIFYWGTISKWVPYFKFCIWRGVCRYAMKWRTPLSPPCRYAVNKVHGLSPQHIRWQARVCIFMEIVKGVKRLLINDDYSICFKICTIISTVHPFPSILYRSFELTVDVYPSGTVCSFSYSLQLSL